MTLQTGFCDALKRLGFARNQQVRLYGEVFELLSDPIEIGGKVAFVDAREKRSGQIRRVHIPLTVLQVARQSHLGKGR